jgi:predicted ATP-dependent serine protease
VLGGDRDAVAGAARGPGPVLYVAAEGASGLSPRVAAWEYAWQAGRARGLTVWPEPVKLLERPRVDDLVALVREDGYRLVVVDTLARSLIGADENSARDVGLAVDAADRVKRATGCTVLLVHHTGKDRTTVRGSSALEAGVDTVYALDGTRRS